MVGIHVVLTSGHDGHLIADVVPEWARSHGKPFVLHGQGPAGDTYANGEEITIEAVEFCQILSGRATGDGLLQQEVPF